MKKLFLTLTLLGYTCGGAWAQCTGVFPANTYCGNNTGSPAVPTAVPGTASVSGPGSSTSGDIAVWNNSAGTLLKDTPPLQIYGTIGNNLFLSGPTTGGPLNPTFRAITGADWTGTVSNPTNQNLTSGSAATYTTPANAKWIEVFMVGGGGGGAGASSGGSLVAGGVGGTSTFNSINAIGGAGAPVGVNPFVGAGGAGGTGGTGSATRRQPGSPGAYGFGGGSDGTVSGSGGTSYFGGGGVGLSTNFTSVSGTAAAANTGAGGSGAINTASTLAVGGGGGGGEFVYLIISSPAATYTYTIGAAGTGGSSTNSGGAGGTGFIFVIEHYAP